MKLTRKQLRKLIAESFIGAPDGTVYTQRTKEVLHPDFNYEMDVPVVYGQDDTKVATPKLYGVLTRNWHEIHRFHEKGPEVYKALMDPKEDPETKMQFLSLLLPYGIITVKELEDIHLEHDLLTSPDFAEYRRLGAERLEKMAADAFLDANLDDDAIDHREKLKLYKNPQYVEWAKKQIDKAVDGGFEYFKDAVQEKFFRLMHKEKQGFRTDYHVPSLGVDPGYFASEYLNQIGALLGSYKGFRSTEDAAYYNTTLDDYTNDKSYHMIMVTIDALVDAGILEELDDGKVIMPESTYQIIRNNMHGRAEDYRKKQFAPGTYTTDDPWIANPNLPVVTEEMIRQIIIETMITPSTSVIQDILKDDAVDARIKTILRTGEVDSINQALNLLSALYPDKYGTIDTDIEGYAATPDYEREFRSAMAQNTWEANTSEAIEKFISWLEDQTNDPSSRMLNHFKAGIASFFEDEAPYGDLGNYFNKDELDLKDQYFIDHIPADPIRALIVDEYFNLGIFAPGGLVDGDLWENLYFSIKDYVDIRGGFEHARDALIDEGILDELSNKDIVIFYDPSGWLKANGY